VKSLARAALELPSFHGLSASLTNPSGPQAYPIVTFSWLLLYENYSAERRER
jgi:hypothetical protein